MQRIRKLFKFAAMSDRTGVQMQVFKFKVPVFFPERLAKQNNTPAPTPTIQN